jgi:hypothetical protein
MAHGNTPEEVANAAGTAGELEGWAMSARQKRRLDAAATGTMSPVHDVRYSDYCR